MQDLISNTADVFKPGTGAFLKLRNGEEDVIVSCRVSECEDYAGDQHSTPIVYTSNQFSSQLLNQLQTGMGVVSFHLIEGVLYTLPASVVEVVAGEEPRVKLLLPRQCRGRSLRKNQRYAALGTFQLLPDKPLDRYSQTSPVPINISLGGFGLQTRHCEIVAGKEIRFELKVIISDDGQPHPTAPVLQLTGSAIIKYTMSLDAETAYCGFMFKDLAEDMLGALAFWIRTHEALLREV